MVEEKKVNEHSKDEKKKKEVLFQDCSLMEFFNLKQSTPNIFDMRSAEKLKQSHVSNATNIADAMQLHEFCKILPYPIVIYGDNENKTKEVLNHLLKLISDQYDDISLYMFDKEYNDILTAYPFLCQDKIIKYPNIICDNGLFLGDGMMAESKENMIDLGITHIVNMTKMDFHLNAEIKKKIKYLKLALDDTTMEADKIYSYFDKAAKFIDDALNEKQSNNVFVHCMAGVSRSASIVIAYLMKAKKYSLCDAYIHVKRYRPRIHPNDEFKSKLIKYEQSLFGKSTAKELEQAPESKQFLM